MIITKSIKKYLNKNIVKLLTNNTSNLEKELQYLDDAKKWSDSEERILNCAKFHLENISKKNFKEKIKLINSLSYISERCKKMTILNAKRAGLNLKHVQ